MKKQRTAPTPHRIVRSKSIFLAPYIKDEEGGWTWKGNLQTSDNQYDMTINTNRKISGRHANNLYYALSIANAQSENKNEYPSATFDIKDFLTESDRNTDWNARKYAIKSFEDLIGINITLDNKEFKGMYNLVSSVKRKKDTDLLTIAFNPEVTNLLTDAKTRFIPISETLTIKSGQMVEVANFLQSRGQGVGSPVKEFTIFEIADFLHLDDEKLDKSLNSIIRTIDRQLNELHTKHGFPKYKRRKGLPYIYKWVQV